MGIWARGIRLRRLLLSSDKERIDDPRFDWSSGKRNSYYWCCNMQPCDAKPDGVLTVGQANLERGDFAGLARILQVGTSIHHETCRLQRLKLEQRREKQHK